MADPIGVDATGYEVLTKAVSELLNQYPGLNGRIVSFEELSDTYGIAFSASSGALILSEIEDILGNVSQRCSFPFIVVYRASTTRAEQKVKVQTFLDSLGKWICGEPAIVGDTEYKLLSYPDLAQGRKIKRVTRSNSYGAEPTEKGIQDWLMPVVVEYTNEFQRG